MERVRKKAAIAVLLLISLFVTAAGIFCLSHVRAHAAVETQITLAVHSESGHWSDDKTPEKAIDGQWGTGWYGQWGLSSSSLADTPWVVYKFAADADSDAQTKTVSKIRIRTVAGVDYTPQDLLVELGDGQGRWAQAARLTDLEPETSREIEVPKQSADKIRLWVMQKSAKDDPSLAGIALVEVFETDEAATNGLTYYKDVTNDAGVTPHCEGGVDRLEEINNGVYSAQGGTQKFFTGLMGSGEYVWYEFEEAKDIGKLSIWIASVSHSTDGFPSDFAVVYSADGTAWNIVPDQIYENYQPTAGENAFLFGKKVNAKKVGIKVRTKSPHAGGSIWISEMRVHTSDIAESYTPSAEWAADGSSIQTKAVDNATLNKSQSYSLTLSDHFTCDMPLTYTVEGIGAVKDGVYSVDLASVDQGEHTVRITGAINPYASKTVQFKITVLEEGKYFVFAVNSTVNVSARRGENVSVTLADLFTYEGTDTLAYTTQNNVGSIENGVLTLACNESGSYTVTVYCTPGGDEGLRGEVSLAVRVVNAELNTSPVAVLESEYSNHADRYALAAGIAGGVCAVLLAGLAITLVMVKNRREK